MANFSHRLRLLRKEHNMSQSELAKKVGMSKSSVNMWERGEREPDIETLETIADIFNVDMDYLCGVSDVANKSGLSIFTYDNISPITLTPHETKVITAYRDKPEMQPAVDTLLGVASEEEYYIPVAARNGKSGTVKVTSSAEERKAALDKELPGVSTPKKPDTF